MEKRIIQNYSGFYEKWYVNDVMKNKDRNNNNGMEM